MKLQLSKTAEKVETIGKSSGWERFDFEIEAAEDDVALVKHMGQSFNFSAVGEEREEKHKTAHDEAMFGGSSHPLPVKTVGEAPGESLRKENVETIPIISLLSDQVRTMPHGSWRVLTLRSR